MALKIVGSSPIIHPIKQRHPIGMPLFYGMDTGLERALRKQSGGLFLARGRVLRPARRSPVDCELSGGFCLIRHPYGMPLFYGMDTELERRKRKHASGMFSRRGRVLRPARRSPVDCELSGGFCLIRLPLGYLHFMEWIRDSKSPPRRLPCWRPCLPHPPCPRR